LPCPDALAPAQPEPLLVDLAEAARLLGLSTRTLRRMSAEGTLPGAVHIGRRLLFRRVDLAAWVARGCPPPPRVVGRR
jgi:excisionase family DNA binding protein